MAQGKKGGGKGAGDGSMEAALAPHALVEAARGRGPCRVFAGFPETLTAGATKVVRLYTTLGLGEAIEFDAADVVQARSLDGSALSPTVVWLAAGAVIRQVSAGAPPAPLQGELTAAAASALGGAATGGEVIAEPRTEPRLTRIC